MIAAGTEDVLRAYAAIWSEPDPVRRDILMARSLADDAVVVGPGYRFQGSRAISAEVERFLVQNPGARPVLASGFDAHHDLVRFAIAVVDADGTVVAQGEDIAELGSDGRIVRVATFWGALPPVPESWPPELRVPKAGA
jgi:hypothetical protein